MSDENVSAEEARGLLEKATPGPWDPRYHDGIGGVAWDHGWILDGDRPPEHEQADTNLVAAAPDLARTVIALHARLAKADADRYQAESERDAYKRAKEENDERFMNERDEARAERDRLRGVIITVIDAAEDTTDRSSTDKYEEAMTQIADACYNVANVSKWKREHIAVMEAADAARIDPEPESTP